MQERQRREQRQQELAFPQWGGARRGAGRKPAGERAGVSHAAREPLASRFPVHVTLRLAEGLPNLRRRGTLPEILRCFFEGRERDGFRVVEYSVQTNHMHLLVEGSDRTALARGIQGLAIRIARALNRLWQRTGRVFADRYHDRILRTPREVRNALVYLFKNARRHGDVRWPTVDPFTSGPWFDGWRERVDTRFWQVVVRPVVEARTWLLAYGWKRHGLLGFKELPAT
jgi:REP-associated tyrosine transposase